MGDKIIIFGAGNNGVEALHEYGHERVAFFCDNNPDKVGKRCEGIEIISFEKMLDLHIQKEHQIVVTPTQKMYLHGQLEQAGIYDYFDYYVKVDRFPLQKKYGKYEGNNARLDWYVEKTNEIDLFTEIDKFQELTRQLLEEYEKKKLVLAYMGFQEESYYYGNLEMLLNYAGMQVYDTKYCPITSHQDVYKCALPTYMYNTAVIFSGDYYKEKIHKRLPYVPVFSVGPYIYYAHGIYDQKKTRELKKQLGRVVTVFLPHSVEGIRRDYNEEKFVDQVLEKYASKFDTVFLCVYWADINHSICEYAKDKGMHIVSAGYRFDRDFDRRLKTIFDLSDATVVGEHGSNVNYSILFNKPVGCILTECDSSNEVEQKNFEKKITNGEEFYNYKKDFYRIFNENLIITEKQKNFIEPLGGLSKVKTAEELQIIFDLSKRIWLLCEEDVEQYPIGVRKLYYELKQDKDLKKLQILREALGKGFN